MVSQQAKKTTVIKKKCALRGNHPQDTDCIGESKFEYLRAKFARLTCHDVTRRFREERRTSRPKGFHRRFLQNGPE